MKELKDYFDENKKHFFSENMVFFNQCNPEGRFNLHELVKICSDIAGEDFKQRCMDRNVLVEMGYAILLSRYSFRIHKTPVENQFYTIKTWEEKSEALQFVRAFEILSSEGEKLVTGMSSWLLVDINSRRLTPIKKFDVLAAQYRTPTDLVTEHDCIPLGKIPAPEKMELWDERVIKYTDLDGNGHTNNSRYVAFAVDALPAEYQNKEVKDIRVTFNKEATLGQKLQIMGGAEGNKIVIIGKTEEATSFEVELHI